MFFFIFENGIVNAWYLSLANDQDIHHLSAPDGF